MFALKKHSELCTKLDKWKVFDNSWHDFDILNFGNSWHGQVLALWRVSAQGVGESGSTFQGFPINHFS